MFSQKQLRQFQEDGFLVVPGALPASLITVLRERIHVLFNTDISKHKSGDEWACRRNLSQTGLKHMVNAWKGDATIAAVFTDCPLGQAIAELGAWSGARMTSDAVWWKPPGSHPVPFHQDSLRVRSFLTPSDFITCWIALDDCDEDVGALQYARSSHKWPPLDFAPAVQSENIHYQESLRTAARAHGIVQPEIVNVQGIAGTCAFHDGLTWHGSAENLSSDRHRRAIAAHFVKPEARFTAPPTSPIFAYYKRPDSDQLDAANFPIVWDSIGYRSPTLNISAGQCPSWFAVNAVPFTGVGEAPDENSRLDENTVSS